MSVVKPENLDDVKWLDVQIDPLSCAENDSEYQTHLAAVEWSLDPSILIHSAEDILARTHWQELLEPYEHQVKNLITFCRRAPVALIADDVGLGKTISAGLILSELRVRGVVDRCLILAPKLLGPQWEEELREKFRIRGECAAGAALGTAARNGEDVVISTYHSARTRVKDLAAADFDMLILDEAHHMRNLHGTAKPPKMAVELQKALAARSFKYVLMLTATPIQNRLWDLYSLVDLLSSAKGHRNPLGSNHEFMRRYVNDTKTSARVLNMGRQEEFRRHLSQYMVRTRRADCGLEFPDRSVKMVRADQSTEEVELFEVVAEVLQGMNALNKVSVAQAFMSSPHALLKQLDNMSKHGSSHINFLVVEFVKKTVAGLKRTGKERKLLSVLKELRAERPEDWRVVIFTGRKETQKRLGKVIDEEFGSGLYGFIQGGQPIGNQRSVKNFSCSPPNLNIIISTDAGAEGVNLQKGNVVANYDLPWNPMIVEQRIGRVQRLGSVHANVIVLNLVLKDSVEEHVVGRLQEKLTAISATLGDVEGVLESMGNKEEESFEASIRKLVLASMAGQNVDAAVRKQLKSIENAKALYEEEQVQVDRQLGQLDAMHHDGPRMPKLAAVEPRLSEKEFTLKALKRSGGTLTESGDQIRYSRAGYAPEIVCFDAQTQRGIQRDRGIAGGPRVGLYRSGQPAFERLVSEWSRKGNSLVRDVRKVNGIDFEQIISGWGRDCKLSVELEELKIQTSEDKFSGKFAARTAAMVAHDKYEKLVEISAHDEEDLVPPQDILETTAALEDDSALDCVQASIAERIKPGVSADPDVTSFNTFYLRRRNEELEKAGGLEHLKRQVNENFSPAMSANVIGVEGALFSIYTIDVSYRSKNNLLEHCIFRLTSWGEIIDAPQIGECTFSKTILPEVFLRRCDISDAQVEKVHLRQSAHSGKWGLKDQIVVCEKSGEALLPNEIITCEVSGAQVAPRLIAKSDVSGKSVLKELLISSTESELKGTADEVLCCQWDGKVRVPDELGECRFSGLNVSKQYLSPKGILKPLAAYASDVESAKDLSEFDDAEVLSAHKKQLSRLKHLREVTSPDGSVRLILGETRGMMGLGRKLEVYQVLDAALRSMGRLKRK